MATEEKKNPYEGETSAAGAGGKFRKRPFRRNQTTPYDRPPTSLRNPNRDDGWFSKLVVDPANRLINYSAHSLFSSLFRKRLPPSSSETEQHVRDNNQEEAAFVANNSSGKQLGDVDETNALTNCSDGGGLNELEKLLKQKTFTRSEIDHLTALLRSRTVDAPVVEEKRSEMVSSEPMLPGGQKEEYPQEPALENGVENRLVTPYITPSLPIEDVASPAELAKAYMGSRPSVVSSSMLGIQTPALREDTILKTNENLPFKSPIMSIVPRATRHAAVHENGFVTPRSRGRSAIYNMARTPYSRIYPTSTLKGGRFAVEGGPSSSTRSALDHDMLSGSKQGAVKRRSSVLDNDIGSIGPIRRIRHKPNLLYSKDSNLTLSGSSLSVARSGMGIDGAQLPSSSMMKPILRDEVKHGHMKLSEENVDGTVPSTSFSPLPSKSSEMASKIRQQLDKLVSPKEKSSDSRLSFVNDNSTRKLSPSMLGGQSLRSIYAIGSSKLVDSMEGSASAQDLKLTSQRDKVENGSTKLVAPSDGLVPLATATDVTNSRSQVLSGANSVDSFVTQSTYPPQKKRAFDMSSHEENPPALSVIMPSKSSKTDGEDHDGTADRSGVGEKVEVSTSLMSSIFDPTFKPVTGGIAAASQASFGSDKLPASQNGSITTPPQLNFGNKVVPSTELTATGAPSNMTRSGPMIGLEKVVSSKDPGGNTPFVNFGTNNDVDKVSPIPFTSPSLVGSESTSLKFGGSSDSKLGSSISSTIVAGTNDSSLKVCESDNGNTETNIDARFPVRSSEIAVPSAASTSSLTAPTSIFTFGQSSNQKNCSLAPSPSFSSPSPFLTSNNFASQNIFSSSSLASSGSIGAATNSTGTSMTTIASTTISSSNSYSPTPVVASSSSTTSFFKFGSSTVPSTSLSVSSSGSEPLETKNRQDAGNGNLSSTVFGSSSTAAAVGSTGSGIFGFSSSAMTTVNSPSLCPVIGASSGSGFGTLASPVTSAFATSTVTPSVPSGPSPSFPSFGLSGSTAFSSGSSLFSSSSPAANTSFSSGSSPFSSSSSATNIFSSGPTFGLSTSASSSTTNSIGSNGDTSSTFFGTSSWQPSKSPFGSTFSSSSSGFSFATSTTSVASTSSPTMFSSTTSASTPQFLFNSAAATTTQPAFGSPSPAFKFGSSPVNNGQTSMEDCMAEDTVQATPPATSIFGQQPAPAQSNFAFGTPSGASPFQFGTQQNTASPNPSPFQASGSLEFNAAGGSFSLGSGGGDKSNRRIIRINKNKRKK